jgi:hypothetical protein
LTALAPQTTEPDRVGDAHLEIEDDGALTPEDGGRVGEQGVEDAEVAGVDVDAVHDGVLVGVQHPLLPGRVEKDPAPRRAPLLPLSPDTRRRRHLQRHGGCHISGGRRRRNHRPRGRWMAVRLLPPAFCGAGPGSNKRRRRQRERTQRARERERSRRKRERCVALPIGGARKQPVPVAMDIVHLCYVAS